MWWFVAVFVVALVVAYSMAPKPETKKPNGFDDITAPTAEEGLEVPVLFGTRVIDGSNLVWYGDFSSQPILK
jgi:hypothetical protein